jgi:hypothetical protein
MAAVIAAAALPAVARGHDLPAAPGEQALIQSETATLGADHAREHAIQREALQQWLERPAGERARLEGQASRRAAAEADRIAAALPAADEVGQWETQTIPFPTYALNAVVVATGEVMFWGRAPMNPDGSRDNVTEVWLWAPTTGRLERVPVPLMDLDGDGVANEGVPFFSSGQSLLPSGEVLLTGGNLAYPSGPGTDFAGLNTIYSFDPWTRRWTEQPPMRQGRWYPTQVELADGRTVVVAGYDESGSGTWNEDLEVFAPATTRGARGQLTLHAAGRIKTGSYPHLFALPDGKALLAGHDDSGDSAQAAVLDPSRLDDAGASAWSSIDPIPWWAKASQAALLLGEPGDTPRVTVIGGYGSYNTDEDQMTAVRSAATLALGDTEWTDPLVPDQNLGRAYANLIELPDGMLVTVGGGSGVGGMDGQNETGGNQDLKRVELLQPGVDPAWRLGPAQEKWRTYHSTAVLLPDGRVLSAGDDYWAVDDSRDPWVKPAGTPLDQAEIYSPPYLFDGETAAPRPGITSLPPMGETGGVLYGERFGVGVSGARPVDKAVLVAPAATTHGVNMNQRRIELEVLTRQPGGLEVRAPSSAALAPPGWYMLFVLDSEGTPSEAGWVWMRTERPAAPPTPTPPVADPVLPLDRTAPAVRARILRLTRGGRNLRVRVKASEPGSLRVYGRVGGRRVKARTVALRRSGAQRTVYLRMPARAVKALSAGRRLRASVTVVAQDGAGNVARRRLSTRIRRPS